MATIADNLRVIKERVARACERVGRDPSEVMIVGAAKQVEAERICQAVEAGLQHVGENYVQEAMHKAPSLPSGVVWHFIGHLQTNKVRQAVGLFDWIHSLDRVKLAEEISKRARQMGRTIRCLVEVNLGHEESKSGVVPEELTGLLSEIKDLPNIEVVGLMAIPPVRESAEASRSDFRKMRELLEEVNDKRLANIRLAHLSMGMSADFEVAVEEGATIVRIGTALFGPRH
jgi:pyridoxal phosphate enzyme (YggS family)